MTVANGCEIYRELIESLLGDEISDKGMAELMAHSAGCSSCRQLILLNVQLSSPGMSPPQPAPEVMARLRSRVFSQLHSHGRGTVQQTRADKMRDLFLSPFGWRPTALAFGLVMLVLGFTVAWGVTTASRPSGESFLVSQISRQADNNQAFADSEDSPYLFSNVSLRNTHDGRVALGFDMTTHMEMIRGREDPLVKEVLVQSLMAPASIGERLKAIAFTEGLLDRKVKEGLLFAVRFDPSQAVRLKALSILMVHSNNRDIQAACLAILQEDDSIQMRLLAIDYLGQSDGGPALLKNLIQNEDGEESVPLRVRAASYIN